MTQPTTTHSKSFRRLHVFAAGLVTTLLVGGMALAQPPGGGAPAPAGSGVQLPSGRDVTLTPKEMVDKSKGDIARMESGRTNVRKMLEEARQARDVVKVLCLNDKLNQIDVALRSARERMETLESAAGRNDSDLCNHEFTILSVLRQRHDQLVSDANACIGTKEILDDKSSVTPIIDPGIPDEEPYPERSSVLNVPSCTSCYF